MGCYNPTQCSCVYFNVYFFLQKRRGCLIKLLELTWEGKMSEGSLTLPYVFLSATLVPGSMFPVVMTCTNATFCSLNILGAKCSDHLSNDKIIRLELELDFNYRCKDNQKLSQVQSNFLYPILSKFYLSCYWSCLLLLNLFYFLLIISECD